MRFMSVICLRIFYHFSPGSVCSVFGPVKSRPWNKYKKKCAHFAALLKIVVQMKRRRRQFGILHLANTDCRSRSLFTTHTQAPRKNPANSK